MIPDPSTWRSCIEYWPLAVREAWSRIAEKYQVSGLGWAEAEWKAFLYIARDTLRFENENPDKRIPWIVPEPETDSDINIRDFDKYSIVCNSDFYRSIDLAAAYNAGLPALVFVDPIEESKKKLAALESRKKLKLEKQTTKTKISKPKHDKETMPTKAVKHRKGKKHNDNNNGMMF